MIYHFDISVSTPDLVMLGVLAADVRSFAIEADNYTEAELTACQMAMIDGMIATESSYIE